MALDLITGEPAPGAIPAAAGDVRLGRGAWLYHERHGEPAAGRPPLLLLRPLGGNISLWGRFRTGLARTFEVISFDPRGSGRSSAAPALNTTRTMARDALALMDHLGHGLFDLFGMSLGSMVAARLCIEQPERVRRLVLASTTERGLSVSRAGLGQGLEFAACLTRADDEAEACLARNVLSPGFRARHGGGRLRRIERRVRLRAATRMELLKLIGAAARHDLRGQLGRIRQPTLVLAGELDRLIPAQAQRRFADKLPRARFELLPWAGHDLTLEEPEEACRLITEFLVDGS